MASSAKRLIPGRCDRAATVLPSADDRGGMFETLDKFDVIECPAEGCDYRGPVAHIVPHIIGRSDPEHDRIEEEEHLRSDQF